MDDRPAPPPPRNSSRTVAIIAVAVLVVIAIAGIVLAGLRRSEAPAAAGTDATRASAPPMTAAASAGVVEDDASPNMVVFAPGSDQIPAKGAAKLAVLAEKAAKEHRKITIACRVEAKGDRAAQMELAQQRSSAVRQVFQGKGIPLGTMTIKIDELPPGLMDPRLANRVELTLI